MQIQCEILAPAGRLSDIEPLIEAGADAIYVGLFGFSSRPKSSDLRIEEIEEALKRTHAHGKKLYVAINAAIGNEMLEALYAAIARLDEIGVDALIIADYGILWKASKIIRHAELHLSTLTGVYNAENIPWLLQNNVKRLILSSDLFLDEIQDIIDCYPKLDYEIVADGGLCFNSNRQCLLPHVGEFEKYSVYCQHTYTIYDGETEMHPARRIGNCPAKIHRTLGLYLGMGISSFKVEGRTNQIDYILKRIRQIKESKDFFMTHVDEIPGYMQYIHRKY